MADNFLVFILTHFPCSFSFGENDSYISSEHRILLLLVTHMDTSATGIAHCYKNPNSAIPVAEHILIGKKEARANSQMMKY